MPIEQGDIPFDPDAPVLALRPTCTHDLSALPNVLVETGFKPDHDALTKHPADQAGGPVPLVLLFVTRHRRQTEALIAEALTRLAPGGWLIIDGQKTDGIDSLLKGLRIHVDVAGTLSKAHGKVIWLQRPDTLPGILDDWRDANALRSNADGFLTAPGMFSPDAIDPGTRLLAKQFGAGLKGRAADLGAGWGASAALLLQAAPNIETLDLFEAEQIALNAARKNVTDRRARFHWADVAALPAPDPHYDLIISNPPFHQSRAAEPTLGTAFIATAARLLAPKGTALFVANRQLPYEAAFDLHFRKRAEVAANPRYKVIMASGPKPV
ncbi:class I SAM-dependent methyltransferase [Halovulum sp. GXIMD14793]